MANRVGWHVGSFTTRTEDLRDTRQNAKHQSKTGFLGTGIYFFGDKKLAQDYLKFSDTPFSSKSGDKQLHQIELSKYNLYRPKNPTEFVDALRITTINLYHLKGQQLKQEIIEASEDLVQFCDKSIDQITKILIQFTRDLQGQGKQDQLSNRLLDNYDGIDLTGTVKDHFGTGSVIF